MQIDPIFPIPLLRHQVDNKLADEVENKYLKVKDQLPLGYEQYTDYQKNKIINLQEDLPDLYEQIELCKNEYHIVSGLRISREIEYWIQDYKEKGQKHQSHCHGINGVSGIYWIRAEENANPLKFHNPNPGAVYTAYDNSTAYSQIVLKMKATKGMIMMFPSYLFHEVEATLQNDTVRTTLSFNY